MLAVAALGLFVLRVVVIQSLVVASRRWPFFDQRLTWMVAAPIVSELILEVGFASILYEAVEARVERRPLDLSRLWRALPKAAAVALPLFFFQLLELLFAQRLVWHEGRRLQFFGPAGLSLWERLLAEVWLAPWFAFFLLGLGVARSPGMDLWRTTAKRLKAAIAPLVLTAGALRVFDAILIEETRMLWISWWGEISIEWIPPSPKIQVGPSALLHLLLIGAAASVFCVASKQLERS